MKEYKSTKNFRILMIFGVILLCPTFGLWSIIMFIQWLDYQSKSLIVGPKSVVIKRGILSRVSSEIRYDKINSVNIKSYFGSKEIGTIIIFSGNDVDGLKFQNVDYPYEIKREIDTKIEELNK